jgi:uncharacterized delta-60 repeat protein
MKKLPFRILGLLFVSALFVTGALGNPVTHDTSFNGTGYSIQTIVPSPHYSLGYSFVIQPDGKIVLVGDIVRDNQQDEFALVRINTDGTLDTTFGNNGVVIAMLGANADSIRKVRLQADGKIVVVGQSYKVGEGYNFMIVRYNSNGTLDTTFNSTGFVTYNVSGESDDYAGEIVVQPDGKLVIAGNSGSNIVLMRYHTNGTLDTTFDGDGLLIITTASGGAAGQVIVLPDGKLLVTGYRNDGTKPNFLLMRLNSDGSLDTSFGTGGSTTTSVSSSANYISSTDRQSDGKIVVVGSSYIARYSADGILDTTFGTGGQTLVPSPYETNFVRVTADDKILVSSRGAYRFTANGQLDTHFNNSGFRHMGIINLTCFSSTIDIQSDGKLLIGGNCGGSVSNFTVVRFEETRTKRFLDFNGDGLTDISIFRPSSGQWWYLNSSNFAPSVAVWGLSTDRPIPADFTGDGRTDVAVFRPSTAEWFILRSENNSFYSFQFGTAGDIPLVADFDGDDTADYGVFRPSTNEWYIQKSTGGLMTATFGTSGDKPVPSDYDGDFKTDIAIYRPSTGHWWINRSSDGSIDGFQFGTSSDMPVQGDYTGDNKTDAAFFRPSTSEWIIRRSEDGSYFGAPFGLDGDVPVPGNYGGDSRFDFAIYRPSENFWHIQLTGSSYFRRNFGAAGDQPLPNLFVP